jgi:hypothetical protein
LKGPAAGGRLAGRIVTSPVLELGCDRCGAVEELCRAREITLDAAFLDH